MNRHLSHRMHSSAGARSTQHHTPLLYYICLSSLYSPFKFGVGGCCMELRPGGPPPPPRGKRIAPAYQDDRSEVCVVPVHPVQTVHHRGTAHPRQASFRLVCRDALSLWLRCITALLTPTFPPANPPTFWTFLSLSV